MSRVEKKKNKAQNSRYKAFSIVFVACFVIVYSIFTIYFVFLPKSTTSELEKRELAKAPEITGDSLLDGTYMSDMDTYFSDSVPFRDNAMQLNTFLTGFKGFNTGVKIHGTPVKTVGASDAFAVAEDATETTTEEPKGNQLIEKANIAVNNDDKATISNNGIAIVGTRALMFYGGNSKIENYAQVINKYKEVAGENVNVYSMVIPTAISFYGTPELSNYSVDQLTDINRIISALSPDVKAVDVYTPLSKHTNEDIYLRTDHHWAPLGAYYAAQKFAEVAGVDFMDLSQYEQQVTHGYVGSMYSYTNDPILKNNPEDFVYYVPKDIEYHTYYFDYKLSNGDIVGTQPAYEGKFFYHFDDGNSNAYCTFMGGDSKITHVHTNKGNGRKLMIIKDSYGNALPGYLFGSFEDIYVIDMRYFTYNMTNYIKNSGVTDILFANNSFHAATNSTVQYYQNFLTQQNSYVW